MNITAEQSKVSAFFVVIFCYEIFCGLLVEFCVPLDFYHHTFVENRAILFPRTKEMVEA